MAHHSISGSAASAREASRRHNGEFGAQPRAEDETIDLMDHAAPNEHALDLSSWTPVEVDTDLADLYGHEQRARARKESTYSHLSGEVARTVHNRGFRGDATRAEVEAAVADAEALDPSERTYFHTDLLKTWAEVARLQESIDDLVAQRAPYEAEYRRRPWPRAFVVTNAGGHVHSSMDCHTCFAPRVDRNGHWKPGTQFYWATEMSGASEKEIVDASGEAACTSCFPSAPSAALSRPRTLLTPDERRKADEKVEREKAKAERERKKIEKALTPDGSEFVVQVGTRYPERFKTEQAASIWAVDRMARDRATDWGRPMDEATRAGVESILDAVARKHGKTRAEVDAEFEKKVQAKAKREGYTIR